MSIKPRRHVVGILNVDRELNCENLKSYAKAIRRPSISTGKIS